MAAAGFELGDGTDFVLEAPSRVIQLLEGEDDDSQNNNQTHNSAAPCIEGVFDLTAATRLVPGISEDEFVNFCMKMKSHHLLFQGITAIIMKSLSFKGSRLMKRPMIVRERGMTEDTEFVPVRGQFRAPSVGPEK